MASPVRTAASAASTEFSLGYAWYVVVILMVCYTLSFIDRQILSLLVTPIKSDLGISDTRIGLLQGPAFALFYTLLGLPMGRIADRSNRRNLIAVGLFFWSLMTATCSIARSFWSLFFARMGVGVGEATLGPAAFSVISDCFPRERLGKALSVYSMGVFVGAGLALIVGGTVVGAVSGMPAVSLPVIGTIASWRLTFLIVGVPGILAVLLIYTIREPVRRNLLRSFDGQASQLSVREAGKHLLERWRSVVGVSLGLSFQAMCNYSFQAWAPAYFLRVHGWSTRRTGILLGAMILSIGCLGMYFGGWLCDRWQQRRVREAPLKVGVISTVGAGALVMLALGITKVWWTVSLLVPALFFLAMPIGTSYAALQMIFPNQLRGQVSALLFFAINLGGLTLGPLMPGLFNDYLFRNENMVGYSIALTVGLASLVSAVLFRTTYSPYRHHYEMMREE